MVLLDEEKSDGEDSTISLSDLPSPESLYGAVPSPPSPSKTFEFLSAGAPVMSAADDVISGGKLLPFRTIEPFPAKTGETRNADPTPEPDKWRSSSVGDRPRGCLWDDKAAAAYRKLRGVSGTDSDPDPIRTSRPKWYLMAFGSVRVPTGMDLSEIRIRQWRKKPPAVAAEEEVHGSWKLLRSLSCKGVEVAADCRTSTIHVSH